MLDSDSSQLTVDEVDNEWQARSGHGSAVMLTAYGPLKKPSVTSSIQFLVYILTAAVPVKLNSKSIKKR